MPLERFVSYAQNGEDVVLRRAFLGRPQGFWIDVGACDPEYDSVTLNLSRLGWCGVNIEPDLTLCAKMQAQRSRDINIHAAVGSAGADQAFYPTATRGHGTLIKGLAKNRLPMASYSVPVISLASVFDEYVPEGQEVDFLKIDVEGSEYSVIASGDWGRHQPRLVVVESVDETGISNHKEWEETLLTHGYLCTLFDGLNRWYCRENEVDLIIRTTAPANVLDNYITASHAALAARVKHYEDTTSITRMGKSIRKFWPLRP